jgi:hypothetical protein
VQKWRMHKQIQTYDEMLDAADSQIFEPEWLHIYHHFGLFGNRVKTLVRRRTGTNGKTKKFLSNLCML